MFFDKYRHKHDPELLGINNDNVSINETDQSRSQSRLDINDAHNSNRLQRKLGRHHVQLLAFGGSIGPNVFGDIGNILYLGGPLSLVISFAIWISVLTAINSCLKEMVTYLPIGAPFLRFPSRYVDRAVSVAVSWTYFLYLAFLIPYEISVCSSIANQWNFHVPKYAIIIAFIFLFIILDLLPVDIFGDAEGICAIIKTIFMISLIMFTIVMMCGGNSKQDVIGFRNWMRQPLFREYYAKGNVGRFLGFLQSLSYTSIAISGPEYISMCSAEIKMPRKNLPRTFSSTNFRLMLFFFLNALVSSFASSAADPYMISSVEKYGSLAGSSSPYYALMKNYNVKGFRETVDVFLIISAFTAGNSAVYCCSRVLWGMSKEGIAPLILRRTTSYGVPHASMLFSMLFSLFAFMTLSEKGFTVFNWFISMMRVALLIVFLVACVTYIFWFKALKAQHINRDTLPAKSKYQPFTAIYGAVGCLFVIFMGGFPVFLRGQWDVVTFIFSYFALPFFILIYAVFKLWKKTKLVPSKNVDLLTDKKEIDEYEEKIAEEEESAAVGSLKQTLSEQQEDNDDQNEIDMIIEFLWACYMC